MKKTILSLAVAAGLGLSVTSAWAVDMDNPTTTPPRNYALETYSETTTVSGAPLNSTVALGFGFAAGNTDIYVRFDLDGGKWGTTLNSTNMQSGNNLSPTGIDPTRTSVSAGGQVGDTYVIFNLTANNSGVGALEQLNLCLGGVTPAACTSVANVITVVPTSNAGVKLKYALYTTPSDAIGQNNALKAVEAPLLNFLPAVGFWVDPVESTVSVAASFLNFKLPVVGATTRLGSLVYYVNNSPIYMPTGVQITNLTQILDATSSTTLKGDFAAATGVWVESPADSACGAPPGVAPGPGVIATDKQSVTFAGTNTGGASPQTVYDLCYVADGVTPISETTFEATLNTVGIAGVSLPKPVENVPSGKFVRDGAELIAPFSTNVEGYVARVYLSNTGPLDAPFNVFIQSDAASNPVGANGALTSGVVPANSSLLIKGPDLISGQRGTIIFRVSAQCKYINGVFQIRNSLSGDFDSYTLLKPEGHCL